MKRVLAAFLFTAPSIFGFAQQPKAIPYEKGKSTYQPVWFMGLSLDSARMMAKEIANIAGHKYTFVREEEINNRLLFRFAKDGIIDVATLLTIPFQIYFDGENKNLEIKGEKRYYLNDIPDVLYLDIFPFWKKYVDPNADVVETSKKYFIEMPVYTYQTDKSTDISKCTLQPTVQGWHFHVN